MKSFTMIYSVVAAVILFFSCTKEGMETDPPVEKENAVVRSVNKTVMLKLVNDVRSKGCKCGDTYYSPVNAVLWDDRLEAAAMAHSNDMFQKNYFNHTAPDGSNAGVRIDRAGYNWMAYGENIGQGYKTEKEVVEAWLKSPSHCKNIMSGKFKEMGVARVGTYWTQAFGSR